MLVNPMGLTSYPLINPRVEKLTHVCTLIEKSLIGFRIPIAIPVKICPLAGFLAFWNPKHLERHLILDQWCCWHAWKRMTYHGSSGCEKNTGDSANILIVLPQLSELFQIQNVIFLIVYVCNYGNSWIPIRMGWKSVAYVIVSCFIPLICNEVLTLCPMLSLSHICCNVLIDHTWLQIVYL